MLELMGSLSNKKIIKKQRLKYTAYVYYGFNQLHGNITDGG